MPANHQAFGGALAPATIAQTPIGMWTDNTFYQLRTCPMCGASLYQSNIHQCGGIARQMQQSQMPSLGGISGNAITLTGLLQGMTYSGSKPVVVCNGQAHEAKDMDEAKAKAEQLANQYQADAFILKPVTKVAPKRDVVVTELP